MPQKIEKPAKGGAEATQKSGPPYPTKVILCSCCHAPQHGHLPWWQDWSLQFGFGKKTRCTDSIMCTATQLFIFQMVAPWQFFMNKKVQWGDSHCDEPCRSSAVLPQLMTEGSWREPNLGHSSLIEWIVMQHCHFLSLVLLETLFPSRRMIQKGISGWLLAELFLT